MKIAKTKLKEMVRQTVLTGLKENKQALQESSVAYDYLDKLRGLGWNDTKILEELLKTMSAPEARENFEHIVRMHDIDDGINDNDVEVWEPSELWSH